MPTNVTDVNEFTTNVAIPSDGEPANAASLLSTIAQPLANRTRNLLNRLQLVEGDTDAHAVLVPPSSGKSDINSGAPGWTYDASVGAWTCLRNGASLVFPLNSLLRDGMIITQVRARVNPGGATATGTDTMDVSLLYWAYDSDLAADAATVLGSDDAADSDGSIQTLSAAVADHEVDLAGRDYFMRVRGASTATANNDALFGVEITVANPTSP